MLQECIILHLSKTADPSVSYPVTTRGIAVPEDLNTHGDTVSVSSDRVLLGDEYDGSFYIGESEFEYQVFEKMDSSGVKLSSFGLKAETGKVQFDKYKEFAQPTEGDGASRLIWAENIQRYVQRDSSKRTGKEWLAKNISAELAPNITGGGIVTQRTTANEQPRRIIATLVSPQPDFANSVYSENG